MRIRWSSLSNRNAGQRLAQLGLADAGGPEEQERAGRPVRIGQARARAADRVGDRGDRLVLADHALVQLGFHLQQLVALALHQLATPGCRWRAPRPRRSPRRRPSCAAAAACRSRRPSSASFACASFSLLLELGQLAVLQLGDLVEVALALELLDLRADAVDLFLARCAEPCAAAFSAFQISSRSAYSRSQPGDLFLDQAEAALARPRPSPSSPPRARSSAGSGGGRACPSPRAWSRSRS